MVLLDLTAGYHRSKRVTRDTDRCFSGSSCQIPLAAKCHYWSILKALVATGSHIVLLYRYFSARTRGKWMGSVNRTGNDRLGPISSRVFFRWDRGHFTDRRWKELPSAAKSVFPVIACHCDRDGSCYPGLKTISDLAGKSEKTVSKGIKALSSMKFLRFQYRMTSSGWWSKTYHIDFPRRDDRTKRCFWFYRSLIDDGTWAKLRRTSHALYPVMRCLGDYGRGTSMRAGDDAILRKNRIHFENRLFDYCLSSPAELADYADISPRYIRTALDDLTEKGLIEPLEGMDGWRVFVHSAGRDRWRAVTRRKRGPAA